MARSPMRESIRVVIGPIVLPAPIAGRGRAGSVPGRMVASAAISTSASIQVAPGSSIGDAGPHVGREDPAARLLGDAGEVGAVVDAEVDRRVADQVGDHLPPASRIRGRTSGR